MDIGQEFDDDFFEKPKKKEGSKTSKYEAKVCMPLWYMQTGSNEKDPDDKLIALKHQADFYYFSQDYAKAVEAYEHILKLVPSSNNTWKREFMENLCRSYLHLDDVEKALEWSFKLHESSLSTDQKIVSMNLLATVCHKLGKYKEELEALHCCLEAHKTCPEFWLRLGLCYAGLFKIDLPGCSLQKSNFDDQEPCCAFNTKSACQSSEQAVSNPPLSSECAIACSSSSSQCTETLKIDDQESSCAFSTKSARQSSGQVVANPPYSSECAIASSSSSSNCTETCSNKENENTFKCEVCTLGVHIVSSCLIHTRALLDSGGPNPFGIGRDEKIKDKIASSLKHMEVDQSFIDVAATMLGKDFLTGFQEYEDSSVLEIQDCILGKTQVDKNNG